MAVLAEKGGGGGDNFKRQQNTVTFFNYLYSMAVRIHPGTEIIFPFPVHRKVYHVHIMISLPNNYSRIYISLN
jgi:hypothetical protein